MSARDLPPQNLEAERSVLGSLMIDPATMHDVSAILEPSDFYRDAHAVVYKAIRELYDRGSAYDTVALAEELIHRDQFKQIGGDSLLLEITESVAHSANVSYHAEIVRQKSIVRKLIQSSTETIREGYSGLHTAQELLEKAEQRVFAIGDHGASGGVVSSSEAVATAIQVILGRAQGKRDGVLTGFNDLDYLLDGLKPQQLCYLGARPSQGKTALALSIVDRVAVRQRKSVLFFSLEMGVQSLIERLICIIGNIPGESVRRPWLMTNEQKDRFSMATQAIADAPIDFDDRPGLNMSKIGASVRRIGAKRKIDLIVIDYLGLIHMKSSKIRSRQEDVAETSVQLKNLAREVNSPVLCAHQLNRGVEMRDDHVPRMSDLRESGTLEQDADVVLLLHRPDYYNPNNEPGIAEVIVAKNRNGPIGTIQLAFVKECTRFDTLADDIPAGKSY